MVSCSLRYSPHWTVVQPADHGEDELDLEEIAQYGKRTSEKRTNVIFAVLEGIRGRSLRLQSRNWKRRVKKLFYPAADTIHAGYGDYIKWVTI